MFDFIDDIIRFFANAIYNLFISIVDALRDLLFFAFDMIMGFGTEILSQLMGFLRPIDISQYLSGIPPHAAWLFVQVGLPQCLTILGSALAIRLVLQLIPFVRLGS